MTSCPEFPTFAAAPRDALSAPKVDDLERLTLAQLPCGPAWGTPDGAGPETGRMMTGLWRGLLAPLTDLYAAIFKIAVEGNTSSFVETLAEWERDLGLPDVCYGADQSTQTRIRAIRARILGSGVMTKQDILCLAQLMGYVGVTVTEFRQFECGISECGVDLLNSPEIEFHLLVTVPPMGPPEYFECGISECGVDPITNFPRAYDLECILNDALNAEVVADFIYSSSAAETYDSIIIIL